jgi:hypothetical protein
MNIGKNVSLLLNASYEPLRIISARRALTLITKGKAAVELPTSKMIYPGVFLPSVIRLRTYKRIPIRMQIVTRKNLYLRDAHTCQYCGHLFNTLELTLDHIIPRSKGGSNSWDNLVAACAPCNRKKDDRTPEEAGMMLLHRPLPASVHTGRHVLRSQGLETKEWGRYLYADSDGDKKFAFN